MGRLGEQVAARYLQDQGAIILGRNVRVGRGEIDLHVTIDGVVVAVEVKALVRSGHEAGPLDHFTTAKADQVWTLGHRLDPPARRVDVVGVTFDAWGAEVQWLRRAV